MVRRLACLLFCLACAGCAAAEAEVPGPSATLLQNPTYGEGIGLLYQCTANYFVDSVNGNDGWDGKSATHTSGTTGPWATIQHADTPYNVVAATWSAGRAAVTVSGGSPPGWLVGQPITFSGMSPGGYNGTHTLTGVAAGGAQFLFALGGNPGPYKSGGAAELARNAGDCINVAAGSYTWTPLWDGYSFFQIDQGGSSASPTGYVTYRCESLDSCHIHPTNVGSFCCGDVIDIAAPYLIIDGFEIDGGESLTYGGWAAACVASGATSGIGHHIWVLNNRVHGCNLGGISLSDAEWYFAIHNEVYDNAWTSGYQGSGIGFVVEKELGSNQPPITGGYSYYGSANLPPYGAYTPTAQDKGFAPYHIMALWNLVHDNGCTLCTGSSVASQASLTTTGNIAGGSTTLSGLAASPIAAKTTATTTKGGTNIAVASATGIAPALAVSGSGIPRGTYVAWISGTTVTLTQAATTSASGVPVRFAYPLVTATGLPPLTYVATASTTRSVVLSRPATATATGISVSFFTPAGGHTDGNGIILDTWCALNSSGACGASTPGSVTGNTITYPDQSLVAFNDVENNGGRGIHVFASNNVTVANNSTYDNGLDIINYGQYGWDEIDNSGGQHNTWYNNVAMAVRPGNNVLVAGDGRGLTDLNNTYGQNVVYAVRPVINRGIQLYNDDTTYWLPAQNRNANPNYVNPGGSDPGNLTLDSNSRALGYAYPWTLLPSGMNWAGAYP